MTNIVHKIGSTVLASAGYVRTIGNEPTRITRENGSYVLLAYDSALRMTNEVVYEPKRTRIATDTICQALLLL